MPDRPDHKATPFFKITQYVEGSAQDICRLISYAHTHNIGDVENLVKLDEEELRNSVSTPVYNIFEQLRNNFQKREAQRGKLEAKLQDDLQPANEAQALPLQEASPSIPTFPEKINPPSQTLPKESKSYNKYLTRTHKRDYSVLYGADGRSVVVGGFPISSKYTFGSQKLRENLERIYQIFNLHSNGKDPDQIAIDVGISRANIELYLRRARVLQIERKEPQFPEISKEKKTKKAGPNPAPTENPLSFFYDRSA